MGSDPGFRHHLLVAAVDTALIVVSLVAIPVALRMINAATADACGAAAPRCRFLDLAGAVDFAPEDFYDLGHTTPAGARKIGAFLAQELAGHS